MSLTASLSLEGMVRLVAKKPPYITLANKELNIAQCLSRLFGIDAVDGFEGQRVQCPEGYDHSDGGARRSMRIYSASNRAFCFSHNKTYRPVDLAALCYNMPRKLAAKTLLEEFGVNVEPPTVEERNDALDKMESGEVVPIRDSIHIKTALLTFAESLPNWEVEQYRDDVLDLTNKVLQSLHNLPDDASPELLEKNLGIAKDVMKTMWTALGLDK